MSFLTLFHLQDWVLNQLLLFLRWNDSELVKLTTIATLEARSDQNYFWMWCFKKHCLQELSLVIESKCCDLLLWLKEKLGLGMNNLCRFHLGPILWVEDPSERPRHITNEPRIVYQGPVMLFFAISAHLEEKFVFRDKSAKKHITLASLPHEAALSATRLLL